MIDQIQDMLVASKLVPVASSDKMGSSMSSTSDSSIVSGMHLMGRYFCWLMIPLNCFKTEQFARLNAECLLDIAH